MYAAHNTENFKFQQYHNDKILDKILLAKYWKVHQRTLVFNWMCAVEIQLHSEP